MPETELYAPAAAHSRVPHSLQHRAEADQSLVSEPEVSQLVNNSGFGFVLYESVNFVIDLCCFLGFEFIYRCREKQRKEASRLQTVNRKLTAMNKLLMEENDRLQKQVSHLVYENSYFRQQTQNVCDQVH